MEVYGRADPPCETCFVDLAPKNKSVITLFHQLCSQTNMNGDLDITAAKIFMELNHIENQRQMLDDLLLCSSIAQEIRAKKDKSHG